jgi:hypothetical protein
VLVLDDDGGRYTAGVAEVLIDQGKQVLVATHFNALFPATFYTLDMPFLYQRLFEEGLSYRLNVWTSAIDDGSVSLFNIYTGALEETVDVDTVVLATGPRAMRASTSRSKDTFRIFTESATASRRESSTTRSKRGSSPGVSCGRLMNAISTRVSSSGYRRWR